MDDFLTVRFSDSADQKRLDQANAEAGPLFRIELWASNGDNKYIHFAIRGPSIPGDSSFVTSDFSTFVVFGGYSRFDDAISVLLGLSRMYKLGVFDERKRILAKIESD